MNALTQTVETIAARCADNAQLSAEDYVGEDGLIYCGKCNTPKQHRIVFLNMNMTPFVPCKCGEKKINLSEKEAAARLAKAENERNRSICFPDSRLREWTFENSDHTDEPTLVSVRKYCENFDKALKDGCGLMLYGDVGVGKTYAAACAANKVTDLGYKCLMTDFSRIINTLWGLNQGKQDYLDSLNRFDLLIIDDLSAERDTEYANGIVTSVIDSRCKSGKPMIVTTNLNAEEIFSPEGIRKKRIYSRLCEMCIPLHFVGNKDLRKIRMAEMIGKYKELLAINQ